MSTDQNTNPSSRAAQGQRDESTSALITFVTTCMGRLEVLKQSLPLMLGQTDCKTIVVDFSCPQNCGDWVEDQFSEAHVVRCPGHQVFHRPIAKNSGVFAAQTPWVCLIDADILVADDFSQRLVPLLQPDCFFRRQVDASGTTGTIVLPLQAFQRIGGHDIQIAGWGDEDIDLCDALRFHGLQERFFDSELIRHLDHSDDQRVTFHETKDHRRSYLINRMYRLVKWDLARLQSKPLSTERCESLYRDVTRVVTEKLNEGVDGELRFDVGKWDPAGLRSRRTLSFELSGQFQDPRNH